MSAKTPAKEIFVAGPPRVQLLPPSVRIREKNRQTRRLLVLLVVLALTLVAGGLSFGYFRALAAEAALVAAQNRTSEILLEQAKYADASRIAGLVASTKDAQKLLTANEVDWAGVMADLEPYLPAGATFGGVSFMAPAPWEPDLVPEGPLRAPRVATLSLIVSSQDYDQAARFVAAVQADESVADVTIVSTTKDGGRYLTTISLTLNDTVLKTRFDESDDPVDEEPEEEETDETETDAGTPTPTPTVTEEADE